MKLILFIFLFLFSIAPAMAEQTDEAFHALTQSKSLKCKFDKGYAVSWKSGEPKFDPDKMGNDIVFDAIGLKQGTARIIGNAGAGNIVVMTSLSGITFLEKTGTGNLVFTTVFFHSVSPTAKRYVAVMSRHMDMFGPAPSQFHGSCTILE